VIVYHFNPEFVPFGYLGVDLFFIISGFLITKQLIKSIEQESFEIKQFYFKRFKRIIPALVSSSIFTVLVGYFNLSLEHFYELFRGLKYSLLFVGNIFFSQIIDYFSIDSERNLIVNLWSLSVEEQFYIIFPFVVLIGIKIKKIKIVYFFNLCLLISLLSFSEVFYEKLHLSNIFFGFEKYIFYSPFTRTSQFLLGAIAATTKVLKLKKLRKINYLYLIILSFFLFSELDFYNQEIISLLSFFLLLNETRFDNHNLSKLFVHIGNISYSLYLFHQPILAGIRNHNFYATMDSSKYIDMDSMTIKLAIICTIYGISLLNYLYVEEIYRNIQTFSFKKFRFILVAFTLIISISMFPKLISSLYNQNNIQVNSFDTGFNIKPGTNYLRNNQNQICIDQDNLNQACIFGKGEKALYVLGDSTISSIVSSLLTENMLNKYTIVEYTKSGCYPVLGNCSFKSGQQYYDDVLFIKDSLILMGGNFNTNIFTSEALLNTIELLTSKNNEVILVGYIPSPRFDESMYFKKNKSYLKSFNESHYFDEYMNYQSFNQKVADSNIYSLEKVRFIDVFNVFCEDNLCNYFNEQDFLFIDGSHLSFLGSTKLYEESGLMKVLN
jgi:peptidoglycan/LPS O-acetylase OafA/YrhL